MTIKLGIIGAMEVEVDQLVNELDGDVVGVFAGTRFHEGTMGPHDIPVVVVRCGVGKTNAAMCTQALIDHYDVTHVINTGIAGALDEGLHIGDLVISTDAVHHDMDVIGLGYTPGFVPELEGGQTRGGKAAFEADEWLRGQMRQAALEAAPEITIVEGRVASGDLFVCEQADRDRIAQTFGASCCEMEGASIAHVCWRNDVPFVIVRAISDNADDTSKVEYRDAEERTAHGCAEIVRHAVDVIGAAAK